MNDLHEKKENDIDGSEKTENSPHEETRLYYKKLSAHLLLGYQAYLKNETVIEPEIRAAIWRTVKLQEGFPVKIRMMQLDILGYGADNFDGEWNEIKDSLFPLKDDELLDSPSAERSTQIQEYKDAIFELLALPR